MNVIVKCVCLNVCVFPQKRHEEVCKPPPTKNDLDPLNENDVASVLKNNSSDRQLLNDCCDQCDFATTRLSDLKSHQKANHEGRTDNNAVDPVII